METVNNEISKNVLKTGTLTIGIVCKDGIVVAADRRQSFAGGGGAGVAYIAGEAKKIQEINERIIATTAGNASDSRRTLELIRAELRLRELKTREETKVEEAANLLANMSFNNIRQPSMIPSIAHFLVAGYDEQGTDLFEISPDGYIQKIEKYSATGAGLTQAHPILDSEYSREIDLTKGTKLAIKCIRASMAREPSVGQGIDIYTVKKGEVVQTSAQVASYELQEKK